MTIRFLPTTFAIAALLSIGLPTEASAAKADKAGKGKKAGAQSARLLAKFDKNGDGTIDAKEAEPLKAQFSALAAVDTDHDGKLSDSEIAAAKVGKGGKKKQKGNAAKGQKKANGAKKGKGAKKQA